MNRKQKRILIAFVFSALLIGLFPPWRYDLAQRYHRAIGFHFLLSDPHLSNEQGHDNSYYVDARIDMSRLEVEWMTLVLVCGAWFVLSGRTKEEPEAIRIAKKLRDDLKSELSRNQ